MRSEYAIKTELLTHVEPKRPVEGGKLHYYVRIYIEAPATALDSTELVKYELHHTFRDRYRVSTDRSKNFEIRIWTYGYFDIKASILRRDGQTIKVSGYVEWKVPAGMPFDDD